jgi:hypothetical protein
MVKLGKNMKGKAGAAAKGGKGGMSAEDQLLRDRLAAMERADLERKMILHKRNQMRAEMDAEAANTKINRFNIQNQWRKYMRMAKVESLRKDIEILSQNHERDVDRKDAVIQVRSRHMLLTGTGVPGGWGRAAKKKKGGGGGVNSCTCMLLEGIWYPPPLLPPYHAAYLP